MHKELQLRTILRDASRVSGVVDDGSILSGCTYLPCLGLDSVLQLKALFSSPLQVGSEPRSQFCIPKISK